MEETIALSKENERKFKRKVNKTKGKVTKGKIVVENNIDTIIKLKQKRKKNITIPKIDVKAARLKKTKPERGLVYVGHIPHGFYEEQMGAFFKQFGKVTNCRVNRSARTGASKGFGYVEFKDPEVAKIAAETMNNYLMFKRRIISKYIPPTEQRINIFCAPSWSETKYPMAESRRQAIRVHNNNTYVNYEEECKGMMKSVENKLDKLKALGISYVFKFNDIPEFGSRTSNEVDENMSDASKMELSSVEDSDNSRASNEVENISDASADSE